MYCLGQHHIADGIYLCPSIVADILIMQDKIFIENHLYQCIFIPLIVKSTHYHLGDLLTQLSC